MTVKIKFEICEVDTSQLNKKEPHLRFYRSEALFEVLFNLSSFFQPGNFITDGFLVASSGVAQLLVSLS